MTDLCSNSIGPQLRMGNRHVRRLYVSAKARWPPLPLVRIAKDRCRDMTLAACSLIVAAVSVHDAMLLVLNSSVIDKLERNPIGSWLIELQGGDVWLFVSLKLLGTAVVCAVLFTLYEFCARLALAAGGGVAVFQLILLWHLTFAWH